MSKFREGMNEYQCSNCGSIWDKDEIEGNGFKCPDCPDYHIRCDRITFILVEHPKCEICGKGVETQKELDEHITEAHMMGLGENG